MGFTWLVSYHSNRRTIEKILAVPSIHDLFFPYFFKMFAMSCVCFWANADVGIVNNIVPRSSSEIHLSLRQLCIVLDNVLLMALYDTRSQVSEVWASFKLLIVGSVFLLNYHHSLFEKYPQVQKCQGTPTCLELFWNLFFHLLLLPELRSEASGLSKWY